MSDNQVIPEAAVDAAAKACYERCGLLWANVEPEWRDDELANARAALEAAAPHILGAAAHDLAGADKTSHWDEMYQKFEDQDGGDLSSDSTAYLSGIADAMRFLQARATK